MNRVTKISAWLAIWLFIASALAIFPGAVAAAQSGETSGIMQTVQYNEEYEGRVYRGTLDIRIQSDDRGSPPGELVLTDPSGDRTGPEDTDIHLRNPMSGLYHLRIIGREIGVYTLFLKAYSRQRRQLGCAVPTYDHHRMERSITIGYTFQLGGLSSMCGEPG